MTIFMLSGACGAGKTAIKDELSRRNPAFACIDADQIGVNWSDYAKTERENRYRSDNIARAVGISEGRDILYASCTNPLDYFRSADIPACVDRTFFIALTCSENEITRRLKARPPEYGCGSDEFIRTQIDYNNWFKRNSGKFQLIVDTSSVTVKEAADIAAEFIERNIG